MKILFVFGGFFALWSLFCVGLSESDCPALIPKACVSLSGDCDAKWGSSVYLWKERLGGDAEKYHEIESASTCSLGMGCYEQKCEKTLLGNNCSTNYNCTGARNGLSGDVLWDMNNQDNTCKSGSPYDICSFTGTFSAGGDITKHDDVTCIDHAEFGLCVGVSEGKFCSSSLQCGGRSYCNASSLCAPLILEGNNCTDSSSCHPDSFCDDIERVCRSYNSKGIGANCSDSEECLIGLICLGEKGEISSALNCKAPPNDMGADCPNVSKSVNDNPLCYRGEDCVCVGTSGNGRCRSLPAIGHDPFGCERCLYDSNVCNVADELVVKSSCAEIHCKKECQCRLYDSMCKRITSRYHTPLVDSSCLDTIYDYLDHHLSCDGYSRCSSVVGMRSTLSLSLIVFSLLMSIV